MDGITLKISGTFKGAFEEIANQMPNIEKRALYHAAYFLRDEIRKSFKSKLPKADQRNPRYSDTLLDAVGFSKVDGASLNVNAMGNRKSSSGTYRARFFEAGTKDRYQKTRNGIRLKKKKFIGKIKPTNFFSLAVQANRGMVASKMEEVIIPYIKQIFDKNI